jgi:uncharacterized protein (DUF4213/DUF364 family)
MNYSLDIDGVIQYLIHNYRRRIEPVVLDRVVIGQHLTAIQFKDGTTGVSGTLHAAQPGPCKVEDRYFGPFSPGNFVNHSLLDLLDCNLNGNLIRSVKMAAISAFSSTLLNESAYEIRYDYDPIQSIVSNKSLKVCLVGAFQSYIKRLETAGHTLKVVELEQSTLFPQQQHLFVPYANAEAALKDSEVIIITGLTLVNGTFSDLINHVSQGQQVILVGPSAAYPPKLLFDAGVTLIGSLMVLNPKLMIEMVEQGGSGYHLYRGAAQKIGILNG